MKPFLMWYPIISLVSAIFAITIQSNIYNYLLNVSVGFKPNLIFNILTASATYIIIYKSLIKFYELYGWKYLLKKYNIEGKWYHELVSAQEPEYKRLGTSLFLQDVFTLSINGINYDANFNRETRTIWKTESVYMDKTGFITFSYQAYRSRVKEKDNIFFKEGIMYAQIEYDEKNRPFRIVGEFLDSIPSTKRGAITWCRDASWKNNLEKNVNICETEEFEN